MSIFAQRLVEARREMELKQSQLAEMVGVSPTRLNYWEKGKAEPSSIALLVRLADTLNVSIDWLAGRTDN